jgi:hypothetical protein
MAFEKWGKVHRFTSVERLEECLVGVGPMHPGKEFSHASKIEIVRRQIQLREQCDGIRKAGDVTLSDRARKGDPDAEGSLLGLLLSDFRAVLQQEAAQGTPEPKKPELVKPRAHVVGSTDLAKQLLEKQREKAAAHTRAFHAQHHGGVFVAFKMTRTRVPDPKQHVGVKFKKLFENAEWWDGVVSEHHDDVQRWRVTCQDGDVEDFTVASMQQHLGNVFVCGEPRGPDAGLAAPQTASALREGTGDADSQADGTR